VSKETYYSVKRDLTAVANPLFVWTHVGIVEVNTGKVKRTLADPIAADEGPCTFFFFPDGQHSKKQTTFLLSNKDNITWDITNIK
jgi:hypothetical protein